MSQKLQVWPIVFLGSPYTLEKDSQAVFMPALREADPAMGFQKAASSNTFPPSP